MDKSSIQEILRLANCGAEQLTKGQPKLAVKLMKAALCRVLKDVDQSTEAGIDGSASSYSLLFGDVISDFDRDDGGRYLVFMHPLLIKINEQASGNGFGCIEPMPLLAAVITFNLALAYHSKWNTNDYSGNWTAQKLYENCIQLATEALAGGRHEDAKIIVVAAFCNKIQMSYCSGCYNCSGVRKELDALHLLLYSSPKK